MLEEVLKMDNTLELVCVTEFGVFYPQIRTIPEASGVEYEQLEESKIEELNKALKSKFILEKSQPTSINLQLVEETPISNPYEEINAEEPVPAKKSTLKRKKTPLDKIEICLILINEL